MTELPFAVAPVMGLIATTQTLNPAGASLVNGTPAFLTWTPPADGQMHRINVISQLTVSGATEVGGLVNVQFTDMSGAVQARQVFAAAQAVGYHQFASGFLVQGGGTVTLFQASALTAGAALLWAEIWGS